MKKLLALLLLLLFVTGCGITRYNDDFRANIDQLMSKDRNLYNTTDEGYKYYLPRNVKIRTSYDYNKILYSNGNIYYLYVDIISYYHKVKEPYEINNKAYYSKILNYGNKQGYIEINKINDKYLIEIMYNYAKVETLVSYNDLNDTITNLCYIVSSIRFNNKIIETLVGSDILDFNEEKFNIFEPTRTERNFLDYVNKYDNIQNNNPFPDNNDQIDLNESEDF